MATQLREFSSFILKSANGQAAEDKFCQPMKEVLANRATNKQVYTGIPIHSRDMTPVFSQTEEQMGSFGVSGNLRTNQSTFECRFVGVGAVVIQGRSLSVTKRHVRSTV